MYTTYKIDSYSCFLLVLIFNGFGLFSILLTGNEVF